MKIDHFLNHLSALNYSSANLEKFSPQNMILTCVSRFAQTFHVTAGVAYAWHIPSAVILLWDDYVSIWVDGEQPM